MEEKKPYDLGTHFCWVEWDSFDYLSVLLRKHVTRRLPASIRSFVDPDDIVQEAWSCLLEKLESHERPHFNDVADVAAYLRTIAKFKIKNLGKKARRAMAWVVESEHNCASTDPFNDFIEVDTTRGIIQRLPADAQRMAMEVLELRLHGLSVKEVSARVCISSRAVHRVLKLIQKHV